MRRSALILIKVRSDSLYIEYQKAMEWYLLASEGGDIYSKFRIGQMYAIGRGVPQVQNEAMKWYLLAVEGGDASAQSIFGEMYLLGDGVEENVEEALKWLHLAAHQGHYGALVTLRNEFGFQVNALPRESKKEVK